MASKHIKPVSVRGVKTDNPQHTATEIAATNTTGFSILLSSSLTVSGLTLTA